MKDWFAVYIRARAEKKVKESLDKKEIENYLPLKKHLRQWSDRKKWVEMPVISGYIFVKINSTDRLDVLKTDFVLGYVRYLGADAKIPENQMNAMKCMLGQSEYEIDTDFTNYRKGQPVNVIAGPLTGLKGELIEAKNKKKVMLRIEQINFNIMAELPAMHIELAQ